MGILYVDTGGSALNSGSSDSNTADLTGALAVQASTVVTLDGSPNLTGVVTSGANQSSINLQGATNTARTVFWITAVADSGTPTANVTVDVAPTGTLAGWKIGGRYLWPSGAGVNVVEGALRAGDILQFNNSPATKTVTYLTARTSGDSTSGQITVRGKAGVQPLLNITNTTVVLTLSGQNNWTVSNLALKQDGASGNVITSTGNGLVVTSSKITGGGTAGIGVSATAPVQVLFSEILNCGGSAVSITTAPSLVFGNYIHDNQGDGIILSSTTGAVAVINNILDTNAGKGVYISGAATTQANTFSVIGNTFYSNGVAGLQVDDADIVAVIVNNVFQNDGSHANVIWTAGTAELHGYHGYNDFYASAGTNLTNLTANSTEITTNPQMVDPANGNFAIGAASPAKATGYPGVIAGGLTTGYMDMGAAQLAAGGGGFVIGS